MMRIKIEQTGTIVMDTQTDLNLPWEQSHPFCAAQINKAKRLLRF